MNRAYSQQAMNLTFLRSRLLRKLSLEIRGSDARVYERALMLKKNHIVKPYKNLNVKEKILNFIPRVINKILHLISWRNLMQNNFINLFFRTRYSLPPSIYRNHELAKNNDKFVEEISKYY
ncbi:MAG: hypothetical protein VX086_02375 [Pseudomonadota bacterium]|nr:hypothetical protein [Pseudomonadota bacterium]